MTNIKAENITCSFDNVPHIQSEIVGLTLKQVFEKAIEKCKPIRDRLIAETGAKTWTERFEKSCTPEEVEWVMLEQMFAILAQG